MKFKLLFLFTLFFANVLLAQNTFVRIEIPQTKYRLFEPVVIDFNFQPASAKTQYRYKLDVPSDWLGGLKYSFNKWTEWQNGNNGHVVYSDFKIEGRYKFTVEFRDANNSRKNSSSQKEFNMYLEFPEIQFTELNIDLNRIIAVTDVSKKYSIAAEEFKNSYLSWYKKYEYQFRLLKLTIEPSSFFNSVASTIVEETAWKAAEEIIKSGSKSALAKGAVPWLQKVFLPKTIYDIVKEFSVTTILLFRNYEANKALIMAAINYRLWKYFEVRTKAVLKENKNESFNVFIEKFFKNEDFQKSRIIFPIKVYNHDHDSSPVEVYNINNWKHNDNNYECYKYAHRENEYTIFTFCYDQKHPYEDGCGSGFSSNYYFKKIRNEYFLHKVEHYNL